MLDVARRYALVLFVILARPWTWLVLALGALHLVPAVMALRGATAPKGRDAALEAVTVVEGPSGFGTRPTDAAALEGRLEGRLDAITALDTRGLPTPLLPPGAVPSPEARGGTLGASGAADPADSAPGAWPLLDRFPGLEQLWMAPPDMLSERGWRRIGDHAALELLALASVGSPDAESLARFPSAAREALARLPRLRQLDLRGTGGSFDLLLPPLPALEVGAIGWGRLEENLATLADHSPHLRMLSVEAYPGHAFTPTMLASLRRMPRLRTLSIAAATRAADEPAMLRGIADVQRALPGVGVVPGTYRPARIWTVGVAAVLAVGITFAFWGQAAVLVSTPTAWMLPGRLAPHLFWPLAVAAVCGGMLLAVARSVDAAWMPSLVLAVFATTLGAYGGSSRDLGGLPGRLTGILVWLDVAAALTLGGLVLLGRPLLDRWLLGMMPVLDGVLLAVAGVGLAWKLLRLARGPRILAELGCAAVPGLAFDPLPTLPQEPGADRPGTAARADLRWWLSDVAIDRQLARPVPAEPLGAAGFARLLRRQHSQWQIMIQLAVTAAVMGAGMLVMSWLVVWGSQSRGPAAPPPFVIIVMVAGQGCVMVLAHTAAIWAQRRESLVLDFLRPVSRLDYWLGMRRAIARDLVLPSLIGGGVMVAAAVSYGGGRILPWFVMATVFLGVVALAHAMILLLATTRWPLVVGTLTAVLLFAALLGGVAAIAFALPGRAEQIRWAWLVAGAVFVAGIGIRTGVLSRLESREIG